jgi:FixJ family two-component response regulator
MNGCPSFTVIPRYYSHTPSDPAWLPEMLPRASRSSLIAVVDDDISVRESVESLLKSVGFQVAAYSSAEEFMGSARFEASDCLVLDVRLDGMSGPDLQRELKTAGYSIPIVFVTAHETEALRERMMADGAIDCLLKPFADDMLLDAVEKALGSGG